MLTFRRMKGGRGTLAGGNSVVVEGEVADRKWENSWSAASNVSYQSREMSAGEGPVNATSCFLYNDSFTGRCVWAKATRAEEECHGGDPICRFLLTYFF